MGHGRRVEYLPAVEFQAVAVVQGDALLGPHQGEGQAVDFFGVVVGVGGVCLGQGFNGGDDLGVVFIVGVELG